MRRRVLGWIVPPAVFLFMVAVAAPWIAGNLQGSATEGEPTGDPGVTIDLPGGVPEESLPDIGESAAREPTPIAEIVTRVGESVTRIARSVLPPPPPPPPGGDVDEDEDEDGEDRDAKKREKGARKEAERREKDEDDEDDEDSDDDPDDDRSGSDGDDD